MNQVYQIIADKILALMEKGLIPWQKPWTAEGCMPKNAITGKTYRGVNVMLLASTDFKSPYWMTFNQAKSLGGSVKTGEHSTMVVFWKLKTEWEEVETSETDKKTGKLIKVQKRVPRSIPMLRYYSVFNLEQCQLPEEQTKRLNDKLPKAKKVKTGIRITDCEDIIKGWNCPTITEKGCRAFYRPGDDSITIPEFKDFESPEGYYSTAFHEGVHSTGHNSRLDRFSAEGSDHIFGSESYSKEELVAELGSAFLCAETGISRKVINNQAGYIQSWMKKIRDEPKLIVCASAQAQKAVDFILKRNQATEGGE